MGGEKENKEGVDEVGRKEEEENEGAEEDEEEDNDGEGERNAAALEQELRRSERHSRHGVERTLTLFLVRHAESKWNEAQHHKSLRGLMAFDHPLTMDGIRQSCALARRWETAQRATMGSWEAPTDAQDKQARERLQRFLEASRVFSSPLTRAMQTAMLSLGDHRATPLRNCPCVKPYIIRNNKEFA